MILSRHRSESAQLPAGPVQRGLLRALVHHPHGPTLSGDRAHPPGIRSRQPNAHDGDTPLCVSRFNWSGPRVRPIKASPEDGSGTPRSAARQPRPVWTVVHDSADTRVAGLTRKPRAGTPGWDRWEQETSDSSPPRLDPRASAQGNRHPGDASTSTLTSGETTAPNNLNDANHIEEFSLSFWFFSREEPEEGDLAASGLSRQPPCAPRTVASWEPLPSNCEGVRSWTPGERRTTSRGASWTTGRLTGAFPVPPSDIASVVLGTPPCGYYNRVAMSGVEGPRHEGSNR